MLNPGIGPGVLRFAELPSPSANRKDEPQHCAVPSACTAQLVDCERESPTTPDRAVTATGLDRFVDFTKPDFAGRAAALAERSAGPRRRFVVMEVEARDADVVGYESIMRDGTAVGYVTSGAFGHCVRRSLAAGYVPAALARDGEPDGLA